ncbi:TetR/AcrR family transcriptional regulator [Rhodococcus sp. HNM0563]|uniref:TetR/AcrR family transcriptional regulator n=1 Tax=Rhodococcus sp. F64268 TaxID=2926402 RepID=UPI00146A5999|nr:TetR/AcrR family transcriptional regulator [Rhodococcus sp. HNM0563]
MEGVKGTDTKRRRLGPAERRAQLIDLGMRMLAERPLDQISVEDIADEAGVSRGLLFHYFSSKHEFHVELVRHISRDMLECTAPDDTLEPFDMLRGTIVSYADYVTERRDTYVSMLRGTASGDPDMREVFEQTRTAMVERTLRYLPDIGIEAGPAVRLAVRGWVAFVEDITIAWLREPTIDRDQFIELAVGALPAVTYAAVSLGETARAGSLVPKDEPTRLA